jgi:hypothetical protein
MTTFAASNAPSKSRIYNGEESDARRFRKADRSLAVRRRGWHEWLKPGAWGCESERAKRPQRAEVFALPIPGSASTMGPIKPRAESYCPLGTGPPPESFSPRGAKIRQSPVVPLGKSPHNAQARRSGTDRPPACFSHRVPPGQTARLRSSPPPVAVRR